MAAAGSLMTASLPLAEAGICRAVDADDRRRPLSISRQAVERSALWAAYGDALGFQSELVGDASWLQRRIGGPAVTGTVPWRRRIGGRGGLTVELPAGTYSDDTQLRLAVGRCRRASGRFDAEAFSKIELGVFLAYELGAGRGTRQAAQSLARRPTRWSSNFYSAKAGRYVDGGGNGAAMRIQPHVWAAPDAHPSNYLRWVLRDAVTTHGHPHAILGAVLHALSVGSALRNREIPDPGRWPGMIRYLERVPDSMAEDEALADRWLTRWEHEAGRSWRSAVAATAEEALHMAELAAELASCPQARREDAYKDLLRRIGGLDAHTRGSGLISAIAALFLSWLHREEPETALMRSANLLTSDTDTIASMAGAILGCVAESEPSGELLDREVLRRDAQRLHRIALGEAVQDFPHPDPLRWESPPTRSDALGLTDQGMAIAGLGPVEPAGEFLPLGNDGDLGWQWQRLWTGQSLLVKRRMQPQRLPDTSLPHRRQTHPAAADPRPTAAIRPLNTAGRPRADKGENLQEPLFVAKRAEDLPQDPEDGLALWLRSGRSDEVLLALVRHYASGRRAVGTSAAFATLVAEHWWPDQG